MPSTAQEEATSVTDTDITAKVGKWETIGLPCAKDSGWMGGICIFKDSCQRQETQEEGPWGNRGVLEVGRAPSMLNGIEEKGVEGDFCGAVVGGI